MQQDRRLWKIDLQDSGAKGDLVLPVIFSRITHYASRSTCRPAGAKRINELMNSNPVGEQLRFVHLDTDSNGLADAADLPPSLPGYNLVN